MGSARYFYYNLGFSFHKHCGSSWLGFVYMWYVIYTSTDRCRIGYEEQNEWYFFSHKDKKYPTGTRTNRATMAGFWKATGRDKSVYDKSKLIGMRKTLVFYKGRAPNGQKTDWIMHEYRLESDENGPPQASTTEKHHLSPLWASTHSLTHTIAHTNKMFY